MRQVQAAEKPKTNKRKQALTAAAMCTASLKKTKRCAYELCRKRPRYSAFTDYRFILSELNTLYITDHLKACSDYRFAINKNKNATRPFCTTFQFRYYRLSRSCARLSNFTTFTAAQASSVPEAESKRNAFFSFYFYSGILLF